MWLQSGYQDCRAYSLTTLDRLMCLDRVFQFNFVVDIGPDDTIADCFKQNFGGSFQILSFINIVHDRGACDEKRTSTPEIVNDIDRVRRSGNMSVGSTHTHGSQTVQRLLQCIFANRFINNSSAFATGHLPYPINETLL